MNPPLHYIRLTRDLPVDPAHGLRKGTVWRVATPPQGASSPKTWVIAASSRPVALLRHEWEEVAIDLHRCPFCNHPPKLVRAAKRGHWIVECGEGIDCKVWPMTAALPDVARAAEAWNARQFSRDTSTSLANAE